MTTPLSVPLGAQGESKTSERAPTPAGRRTSTGLDTFILLFLPVVFVLYCVVKPVARGDGPDSVRLRNQGDIGKANKYRGLGSMLKDTPPAGNPPGTTRVTCSIW